MSKPQGKNPKKLLHERPPLPMNLPIKPVATVRQPPLFRPTPVIFTLAGTSFGVGPSPFVFSALPGNIARATLELTLENIDTMGHKVVVTISPPAAFAVDPPASLTSAIPVTSANQEQYSGKIMAGASATFTLFFKPTATGVAQGSLMVTVADSLETVTILLQGTCDSSLTGFAAGSQPHTHEPSGALNSSVDSQGEVKNPQDPVKDPEGPAQIGTPIPKNNGPKGGGR